MLFVLKYALFRFLLLLFFRPQILLNLPFFFKRLSSHSFLLLLVKVVISATSLKNVICSFSGVIDLLSCFLLLVFQKLYSVREKLSVLLGSLSCEFAQSKLLVEGFHIVLGVHHELFVLSFW